jgi:excisionase family DNA binding protein
MTVRELIMEKQIDPARLLTPHQAARLLHLPTGTILKMILRKELRAFKIGRYWRLSKNDLTQWARTHRDM